MKQTLMIRGGDKRGKERKKKRVEDGGNIRGEGGKEGEKHTNTRTQIDIAEDDWKAPR